VREGRAVFKTVAGLAAAGILLGGACSRVGTGTPGRTPIILISVDTLRADRLPAYGYRKVATPALDALARDAVLFDNAYSHVPLTLASHATLFTGLLPFQNRVRDNFGYTLSEGPETLAAYLSARGYATGGAVSAAVLHRITGISRGFGFWDDAFPVERGAERDGAVAAASLKDWIATQRDRPILAFLHLFEPHAAYEAPEPHRSRWPDPYDAEIARSDEILGGFLESLRRSGVYDRSLLLFFSDHGEALGDHGEREHGVFLYREVMRVPLFLKLPRSAHAGERIAAPVALTDLFPTAVRAADLPVPENLAGVPLQAFLSKDRPPARRIYSETFYPRLRLGWSDLASLVDARWHYIEAPRPELYDLLTDPAELRDLSGSLPPAFRTMRLELSRLPRRFELPAEGDPEHARRLASLGYLTARSPAADHPRLPDPKDRIRAIGKWFDFVELLGRRRDGELVAAAREFLAENPAALDVSRMLADALERQGKRGEAIEALRSGLQRSTGLVVPAARDEAVERLAELLVLAGRSEEALEIADPSVFRDPVALNSIGFALAQSGRLEEACRAFEKALSLAPGDPTATLNLGTALLGLSDLPAARARLEEAVRLAPRSAAAWSSLGTAKARLEDEAGAIVCWRHALELDPAQYGALFNLGMAEGRRGNVAAASRALRLFVERAPSTRFSRELAEARRLLRSSGA
jgi:arylsulfatase A-like enzyme/Flp pilus assembly protein TadD